MPRLQDEARGFQRCTVQVTRMPKAVEDLHRGTAVTTFARRGQCVVPRDFPTIQDALECAGGGSAQLLSATQSGYQRLAHGKLVTWNQH